jgi:hypothetical protein
MPLGREAAALLRSARIGGLAGSTSPDRQMLWPTGSACAVPNLAVLMLLEGVT